MNKNNSKKLVLNSLLLVFCVVVIVLYSLVPVSDTIKVEKFNVTFDSNGGSTIAAVEIEKGKVIEQPTAPTKEGYIFVGWMLGDEPYDFSTKLDGDLILTAKWQEREPDKIYYKVTFDVVGGSNISEITLEEGSVPTRPANPVKDGFEFVEWQLNGQTYNFDTQLSGDITVVAIWKEVIPEEPDEPEEPEEPKTKYTVTFNSDGGSAVRPQTIEEGKKVVRPANPKKTGYVFQGWTLNGAAYNFNTPVNKNITLKAVWAKEVTYTVRVKNANGDVCGTHSNVKSGAVVSLPPGCKGLEKIAHTLTFVNQSKKAFVFGTTKVTGDLIISPVYKAKTLKVTCTTKVSPDDAECFFKVFEGNKDITSYVTGITIDVDGRSMTASKSGNEFKMGNKIFQNRAKGFTINLGTIGTVSGSK